MEVRVFTKDSPCCKIDLWNCFRGKRGFISVPVTVANSKIGRYVPKHLVGKGRATFSTVRGEERITLTKEGAQWLKIGTGTYIGGQIKKKHFAVIDDVQNPLMEWIDKYT